MINFKEWKTWVWRHENGPVGKIDHDEKAEHLVAADQEKRHWMDHFTFTLFVTIYENIHVSSVK